MKKFLLLILLVLAPYNVFADISFGGALGQTYAGGVSTRSLTGLDVTGTDTLLLVGTYSEVTSYNVTSCVFDDGFGGDSQSMTIAGTQLDVEGGNHRMGLFYLLDPLDTNSRVLCTFSGSSIHGILASFYEGVDSVESFTTLVDSASGGTVTNLSTVDGAWHFVYAMSANAGLSLDSGGTSRQNMFSSNIHFADSDLGINDGDTHDFDYTWSTGNAGFNDLMLLPVVTGGGGGGDEYATSTAITEALRIPFFDTFGLDLDAVIESVREAIMIQLGLFLAYIDKFWAYLLAYGLIASILYIVKRRLSTRI